jgi:hypothetical protein
MQAASKLKVCKSMLFFCLMSDFLAESWQAGEDKVNFHNPFLTKSRLPEKMASSSQICLHG